MEPRSPARPPPGALQRDADQDSRYRGAAERIPVPDSLRLQ